ncbi:MAG: hypothetical protein V3V97_22765 [Hyphomicrobiaceae bacterium]
MLIQSFLKSLGAGLAAAALAYGVQLTTAKAAEGPTCAPRTAVVTGLTQKFSEKRQAAGLVSNKAVMELYVSEKGSWTILMTTTNGVTCIVASGDTWNMSMDLFGPES